MKKIALGCLALFLSFTVEAKRFSNQYLEFELPNSWTCVLEGAEWVCQSSNEARKKEAIIIFAAKNRGPKDSIEDYQAYLKKAKTFTLPGGQTLVSEPKYANPVEVNGQRWIDALHMASEIPGFYTRYMATVKEDLGVVVTFSVSRDAYTTYKSVFDKIISSIRVFRQTQKNVKAQVGANAENGAGEAESVFVPEDTTELLPARAKKENKTEKTDQGDSGSELIIIAGVIIAGVFFMLKRKKPEE